ncbi:hypothetical protein [Pedobacter sp.]|uniref:hypothetical protein n=1 Tax=Pedobacter sp. TaxID=1411316 RepID=UPI0031CE4698
MPLLGLASLTGVNPNWPTAGGDTQAYQRYLASTGLTICKPFIHLFLTRQHKAGQPQGMGYRKQHLTCRPAPAKQYHSRYTAVP